MGIKIVLTKDIATTETIFSTFPHLVQLFPRFFDKNDELIWERVALIPDVTEENPLEVHPIYDLTEDYNDYKHLPFVQEADESVLEDYECEEEGFKLPGVNKHVVYSIEGGGDLITNFLVTRKMRTKIENQ